MGLPPDLVADLHLTDLAQEPVWPSAWIAGAAHYADAPLIPLCSPIDRAMLGEFAPATVGVMQHAVEASYGAFLKWRMVPTTQRLALIGAIRTRVDEARPALQQILTLETGATVRQAQYEVEAWICACDQALAAGGGHDAIDDTVPPASQVMWQALGAMAMISGSRSPLAAWARHAMAALACGNTLLWKPSPKTLLTAVAVQRILELAVADVGPPVPVQVCQLLAGGEEVGAQLAGHTSLALVAVTGQPETVQLVATTVASRGGRCLADMYGSGAAIVSPRASVNDTLPLLLPYLMGHVANRTDGIQRIIVHESHFGEWSKQLGLAVDRWRVGDPRDASQDCGPLLDADAWWSVQAALQAAGQDGCETMTGGTRIVCDQGNGGCYVRPAVVSSPYGTDAIAHAIGLPILFVYPYQEMLDALMLHNACGTAPFTLLVTGHDDELQQYLAADGVSSAHIHWVRPDANLSAGAYDLGVPSTDYTLYMRRTVFAAAGTCS
ncbi:MAG: aldehyde dehydrogenase family protein [Burkholderiales bacterium]|nr:aldehyde dehydrogenase family protein [Burkholderiales bacterium]